MVQDVRAHTIYFVVTDRFCNSDPSNDAGRDAHTYDATHTIWTKYWGGDLGGIVDKLDYLKNLGASAIWITPVFDQVDHAAGDEQGKGSAAYHGYWAKDFRRLDEHLVAKPTDVEVFRRDDTVFDKLVAEMKRREMLLVLDVVCNHSSPEIEHQKGELYDDGKLLTSYEDDKLGWYHRAGSITDWRNTNVVQEGELCGLADFNENVHAYRAYIKQVMMDWLDKGVGALRVDTVKHMPLWFWQEWSSDLRDHRPDLFLVGEWFLGGCWDPASVDFANRSGMTIFDFSLQRALENALARSLYEGFQEVHGVFEKDGSFARATHLVTFVDNHDIPRLLSSGASVLRLELAVCLVMVARGIPCIYYGTEQYLHDDTNAGADPYNRPMMDRWDEQTRLFHRIQKLAQLRRENMAVQRGFHQARFVSADNYVLERGWGGSVCFAAFNRGAARSIGPVKTDLPDGDHACVLSGRKVTVKGGHIEKLDFDADDVIVLSRAVAEPAPAGTCITFQLNGFGTGFGERIVIVGSTPELGSWDAARAPVLRYVNANLWEGDVDFTRSQGKLVRYKYAVLREGAPPRFEDRYPRRAFVPASGHELRTDRWEGTG